MNEQSLQELIDLYCNIQAEHCGKCPTFKNLLALSTVIALLSEDENNPASKPLRSHDHQKDPGPQVKVCKHCKAIKRINDFDKSKNCKDGHLGTCKACRSAQTKERKRMNAPGKFECDQCKKVFGTLVGLEEHKQKRHPR